MKQVVASEQALTSRQNEVLQYIATCVRQRRMPPTVREIGEHFGIRSTNGVRAILEALERKGRLLRAPRLSRGLELPPSTTSAAPEVSGVRSIPFLGRVAAGSLTESVEENGATIDVPEGFVPGGEIFALKVSGDSMIDSGVFDGDVAFVRTGFPRRAGQMVVARVGDESTLKHWHPANDHVELRPANPAYRPIVVREGDPELQVLGLVVALWRKLPA